jgi:uncharacterized protein YecA (UPF0149 family)
MVDGSVLRRLVLESTIPARAAEAVRDPRVRRVIFERVKIGRNSPCPCGSGKKWNRCHGGPHP